ncbi:hypothetical protein ADUPG1_005904 [Aduncisulcus paluster]|uniref:Arrestin C-terminal-like domain-containing protein n=1 Tax=Aduncisulcus paluster TaxID=2918883 RepID=A0ABQ5KG15_9EUKA|nr:hypothetical protein ADUPG1_005904 [Aduncisulcus paluster]
MSYLLSKKVEMLGGPVKPLKDTWEFIIPIAVLVTGDSFSFQVKGPIKIEYKNITARLSCKETVLWGEYEGQERKTVGREVNHYSVTSPLEIDEESSESFSILSGKFTIPESAPGTCVGGSVGRVEHVLEIIGMVSPTKGRVLADTELYVAHTPEHPIPIKKIHQTEKHTVTFSGDIMLDVVAAPKAVFTNRTLIPDTRSSPAPRDTFVVNVSVNNDSKHKVTKIKTYLYYRIDINEKIVKTGLVEDLFEERLLLPREVYDREFIVPAGEKKTETFVLRFEDNFLEMSPETAKLGYDPLDGVIHLPAPSSGPRDGLKLFRVSYSMVVNVGVKMGRNFGVKIPIVVCGRGVVQQEVERLGSDSIV